AAKGSTDLSLPFATSLSLSLSLSRRSHIEEWISYVTQSGRLMNVMMTKIHHVGKVYHFRAKRQMAQSLGQIAKFNRRYGQKNEESDE
ncbi:hypothetical protein ACMD2_13285, partial [Ananas comosus]